MHISQLCKLFMELFREKRWSVKMAVTRMNISAYHMQHHRLVDCDFKNLCHTMDSGQVSIGNCCSTSNGWGSWQYSSAISLANNLYLIIKEGDQIIQFLWLHTRIHTIRSWELRRVCDETMNNKNHFLKPTAWYIL